MDVALAPAFRCAAGTSHVVAGLFLGGLLLVVAVAAAQAFRARSHGAKLRAEVWKVHGLRPGLILLSGIAEPIDEEQNDANPTPFIELTIHQVGVQRRTRNGHYVQWSESSRSLSERPFMLHTDSGTRVRVEPSGKIDLVDRLEKPVRKGIERMRVARIISGEPIWVRGELTVGGGDTGPYRGNEAHFTVRPPRDRPLFVSSEPIDKEDRDRARAHAICAAVFVAVFALCLIDFGPYHALRAHGVGTRALITEKHTWVTHNKNSTTVHWGMRFHYQHAGKPYDVSEEVSHAAYINYREGDRAPVVYDANDPTEMQPGDFDEIGLTAGRVVIALLLTLFALVGWLAALAKIRPWWRKDKLVENESGML